jgi:hypothetical protein
VNRNVTVPVGSSDIARTLAHAFVARSVE